MLREERQVVPEQPGHVALDGPGEHGGHLVFDVFAGGHAEDVVHFFERGGFCCGWEEEPD